MTSCPHCGKPIALTKLDTEPEPARLEETCWRAPNAHPPHPWYDEVINQQVWCPGVKGTTMY